MLSLGCFLPFVLMLVLGGRVVSATSGGTEPIPRDPTIIHGQLNNGLRYYVRRNARPENRIELRLAVDAGSALEDDDQRGIAHLVEHLCFRGTKHFPHARLVAYLQSLGSDFGPHVNARTSFDETVYRLAVPASAEGALDQSLQVLRDWAADVDFSEEEVEKERKIVIEEWRMRLGPAQRLLDQALPVLFKESRYATRLPIGQKETVESAPLGVIKRFYSDWYRPDNFSVIVVGDIDPEAVEARIQALFADLEMPGSPRAKADLSVPTPPGWAYSSASDPETGSHVVRLSFPRETSPQSTLDDYQQRLAEYLVVQGLNARLASRRERPPAPYQFAQASDGVSLARARTELLLLALVGEGGVLEGIEGLVTEAERLRRHGLTEVEFEREKLNLVKATEARFAEREKQESEDVADVLVWHALRGEPVPPPEWAYERTKSALAQMTLAELNATARRLISERGGLIRVETPAIAGGPPIDARAIEALVMEVLAGAMDPWSEQTVPAALMTELPEQGAVVSREDYRTIGVTELHLANGVRVVLKPSTFKQDEVLFSAYRPGGLSALPDDLDLAGKFFGGYFGEAGLSTFSKADLQRLLAGRKVELVLRLDPHIDSLRGGCSSADLETLLQLIHLAFRESRRDDGAYQTVLGITRTFETNVLLNPPLAFLNDTMNWRFGDHPRAMRLVQPPQAWSNLTLSKVVEAQRMRFGSPAGFTFFFTGSFTLEQAEPLLTRYLGSLPSDSATHEWRDVGPRQLAGPVTRTAARGADPRALLLLCDAHELSTWTIKDTHMVWSLGNILQRTLLEKLRIEQSSAYTLKVASALEKIPTPWYGFEIAVPCAPGNLDAVFAGVNAEIERLRIDGPTPDQIQNEIESQRRNLEKEAQSNGDWLWKLELIYKYDEGFGRLERPAHMIEWLTQENLRQAAQRYWRTDRWLRFQLRPKTGE